MIDLDVPNNTIQTSAAISVITEDNTLIIIGLLSECKLKTQVLNSVPDKVELWEISPSVIVIDSLMSVSWEHQLEVIRQITVYKEVPIIILTKKEIDITELFANQKKDVFLYIDRNNELEILQGILAGLKYWEKLSAALIKTNQLNRILSTNYLVLDTKNECLQEVKSTMYQIGEISSKAVSNELEKLGGIIEDNLKKGEHYQLFKAHFEEVHPLFFRKLLVVNSNLSNNDLKLAAFIKMNFNNSEISFFMGISIAGVKKAVQRLRVKLGLDAKESLRQFIFTMQV